ncbi:hypothetical protein ACSBR1_003877 [Camellia fascicularis]
MEEELETSTATHSTSSDLQNPNNGETTIFNQHTNSDIDSTFSTPFVSATSSPASGGGFFYSVPASPMHFVLCSSSPVSEGTMSASFEFEFSARFGTVGSASKESMSSADELFLNGQIRPMKLSTPLLDLHETEGDFENEMNEEADERFPRVKWRDRSLRRSRRTRSMSPLRTPSFQWHENDDEEEQKQKAENKQCKQNEAATTEARPSSVRRSSKGWVFLKEFLYRSKSEGRNNGHSKFWSSISFSPIKDRKASESVAFSATAAAKARGAGKRRVPASAHELHYTEKKAEAEEMRKKTYLPYRQGLFGCLGFSSRSYGAMNGFARAFNPVSSK